MKLNEIKDLEMIKLESIEIVKGGKQRQTEPTYFTTWPVIVKPPTTIPVP